MIKMDFKKLLVIFLLILISIGILFRVMYINKDFAAEEKDFVKPAIAWKDTGRPVFYHSEQQPKELALWHPPMYIFTLSLVLRLINNEIGARSINIFFSILTAIVIFWFCARLIEDERGKIIGLLSAAFFMVNFYVLSSSVLIDIDILSCFFVFCFVSLSFMYCKTQKKSFLFLAGLSFFFSLANRYVISGLVYFFIGIYYLANKELRKNFKNYLLTGIISGICFLFIWGVYSIYIEPGNFFSFISHNVSLGAEQFSSLFVYSGSFVLNIIQLIRLVTFPAVILIIWSWFYSLSSKSKLVKILLLYILPVFLFFIFLPRPAFGYPRYFVSIFPGVSILLGIFLYKNLQNTNSNAAKKKLFITMVLSFCISLILLVVLKPQTTFYMSNGLIKATNLPDFLLNLSASLPIFFILLFKKENKREAAILILAALILSYSLYFDINLVSHDSHIKEAGDYIKERTNETDLIIAPKAIGYYSERKFYVNDFAKPKNNLSYSYLKEYLIRSWNNPQMNDSFFWGGGIFDGINPPVPTIDILNNASYVVLYYPLKNKSPEKTIGEFYIYNLKSD